MAQEPRVQSQAQQGPAKVASSAGAKVNVYCKMPHGLRLRNFKMIDQRIVGPGGTSQTIQVAEPVGEYILIYGNAVEIGKIPRCRIVMGYAVTEGVDKESWDAWLKDNEKSAMVTRGLIFAHADLAYGDDKAKDQKDFRSGLEPFERERDPRRPPPGANFSDVGQADEQKGRAI